MDFTKCSLRSAITDPFELIEHDEVGCEGCFVAESKAEPIDSYDEEKTVPEVKPAPQKSVRKRRPDEKDEYVPDRVKIARIRYDEGISRNQAAVRLAESRIAIGAEDKTNQAGGSTMVNRSEMPFGPRGIQFPPNEDGSFRASILPLEMQKRYVAIASNFLKGEGNHYRFSTNRFELAGFDEKLVAERFYVEQHFFKSLREGKIRNPYACFVAGSRHEFLKNMKRRLKVLQNGPFQKVIALLPWSSKLGTVGVKYARPLVLEVPHPGISKPLNLPDPRRKCAIPPANKLQRNIKTGNSKCPIEEDDTAFELLKNCDVDFAADASTIRQLLIRPWMNRNYKVAMKCTVKRTLADGIAKKYVVFSKPFPIRDMNSATCDRAFMKWAFKTMCMASNSDDQKTEAELNEKKDTQSDFDNEKVNVKTEKFEERDPPLEADCRYENSALKIDEQESCSKIVVKDEVVKVDMSEDNVQDDILGGILSEMSSMSNTKEDASVAGTTATEARTAKRYSIVSFDVDREREHRVLIRSTNHGFEKEKGLAYVIVKPEYAVWLGTEKCCVEEQIYTYLSGILKGSQWLVTAHVFPVTGDVLQISRKNVKDVYGGISDDVRKLISCRCEMFCDLLDQIKGLDCGEYLVVQRHETLEILSQDTEGCNTEQFAPKKMVAHLYEKDNVSNTVPDNPWNGLNPHIPLVWHIVQSRAPGALPAFRKDRSTDKPNARGKKKQWQWKRGKNKPDSGCIRE